MNFEKETIQSLSQRNDQLLLELSDEAAKTVEWKAMYLELEKQLVEMIDVEERLFRVGHSTIQATDDMAWLKRHVHAGRELLQRLQLDSSRLQKKPVHHRSSVIGRYGETKSVVPAAPGINLPQTDGFSLSRKIKSGSISIANTPIARALTAATESSPVAISSDDASSVVTDSCVHIALDDPNPTPALETDRDDGMPLLFEHFMVIGPTDEHGVDRAKKIMDESSTQKRLSARVSNYIRRSFSSPQMGQKELDKSSAQFETNACSRKNDASIIYRFPEDADPPPPEVCDFCLPLGSKLDYIKPDDEMGKAEEIFYGLGSGDHLSRCFIFILEDKNIPSSLDFTDDVGVDANRLYGICVIHPRLLRVCLDDGSFYSFESQVCYAFITRFPLFEFFFTAISSMMTAEKLERMEMRNSFSDDPFDNYEYFPTHLLEAVLHQIKNMKPPKYNRDLKIEFIRGIDPVVIHRKRPTKDCPEHMHHAVEWALPTLLSWLPVDKMIWLLSLLLCEVKVIVVGCEAGMVSCVVMSLLALLRPMAWVAPLIPILPLKYLEFVESPVPILAGIIVDPDDGVWCATNILQKCEHDSSEMAAVLDVSTCDIYVSRKHATTCDDFLMPGAALLLEKLREGKLGHDVLERFQKGSAGKENKPVYLVTPQCREEATLAKEKVFLHVSTLVFKAESEQRKSNSSSDIDPAEPFYRGSFGTEHAHFPPIFGMLSRDVNDLEAPLSEIDRPLPSPLSSPASRRKLNSHFVEAEMYTKLQGFPFRTDEKKFFERFLGSQMFDAYNASAGMSFPEPPEPRSSHSHYKVTPPGAHRHFYEAEDALDNGKDGNVKVMRSATINFGPTCLSVSPSGSRTKMDDTDSTSASTRLSSKDFIKRLKASEINRRVSETVEQPAFMASINKS